MNSLSNRSNEIPEGYLWDVQNKRYMKPSLFPDKWVPVKPSIWDATMQQGVNLTPQRPTY